MPCVKRLLVDKSFMGGRRNSFDVETHFILCNHQSLLIDWQNLGVISMASILYK